MKKIFPLFLFGILFLVGCGGHTHNFSDYYAYDETHHWHDAICGHDEKNQFAEHEFSEWTIIEEATNESAGLKTRNCVICEYVEELEIPAVPHEHNYESTIVAPTCTEVGYTKYECSCGDSYIDDELSALEHDYGKWQVSETPDEDTPGYAERICVNDNSHIDRLELPALSDGDYQSSVIEQATCTKEGKMLYTYMGINITITIPMLEHTYSDSFNYDQTHHWYESTCGHNPSNYEEHKYGDWEILDEPTEESKGKKARTCSICEYIQYEEIPELEHVHIYEAYVTDPTCTSKGYTTYICKCDDKYIDDYVDIVDHEYGNWYTKTKPTLEEKGELRKDCMNCEQGYASFELPILNDNDYIKQVLREVSCEVDGYYEYKYVKDDRTFYYNVTVEKTGHSYEDTYSYDTHYHYYASTCGHEYLKKDQEEHSFVDGVCTVCRLEYFKFELINDNEYALVGFNSNILKDVEIPDTYKGLPVTVLGEDLFYNYPYAMTGKITFGTNIKRLEPRSIFAWNNEREIYYKGDVEDYCNIEFVDVKSSISYNLCYNIYFMIDGSYKSVTKELVIPDTVKEIPFEAFCGWQLLEKVTIPFIGPTAEDDGENEYFGYIFGKEDNQTYIKLKEITLTGGTILYSNSFDDCLAKTIYLPDSIVEIEENACSECEYLGEVVFGENSHLKTVGEFAFCGNRKMYRFVIPSQVTYMAANTFHATTTIEEIVNLSTFDASKLVNFNEHIIDMASNYCTTMQDSKVKNVDGYVFGEFNSGTILLDYLGDDKEITFPNSYVEKGFSIGQRAFMNTDIKKITIPNTVDKIGSFAFELCDYLTEIIFEEDSTLNTIGHNAFGRSGVDKIVIPASVITLEQDAFWCVDKVIFEENSKLRYVGPQAFRNIKEYLILPKSVVEIGSYAFDDCGDDFVLYFESDKLPEILDDYWNGYLGERYYFYSAEQPTENIEKYWYYDILGLPRLWSDYLKFKELTYTAFGDSITYGADLIIGGRVEKPYPTVLSEILEFKSYENKGVSGATLTTNDQGLTCMTNVITSYTSKTDIISVLGGVNDYNRNLPLGDIDDTDTSTIYGSLHVGMSYLSENYSDSFVFYMTPYKEYFHGVLWSDVNSQGYTLENVSDAIKEVAEIYNIPVLDLFEEGNFESIMYDSDCDGIHPNQDFIIDVMAPQIAEFIIKNYE